MLSIIEILLLLTFIILLGLALYLMGDFYICDNLNCKNIYYANEKYPPPGSKKNTQAILSYFFADGTWPISYIAAAILTPLSLWFAQLPFTTRNFSIIFLTSFVIMYFMITYIIHHYVRPITGYLKEYVQDNCINKEEIQGNVEEMVTINKEKENIFPPYVEDSGISFNVDELN